MKISFIRFPVDLILCLACSVILAPLALFNIDNLIRLILGVPFILFIPGYVLVSALFPFKQRGECISIIERIGLSLGLSVAIVPLFGLALNFFPWGIRLQPLLLLLIVFIFSVGMFALYRWYKTEPAVRFSISFDLSLPKFEDRFNTILTLILVILIIISLTLLLYVIVFPKVGEKFTEFYVLDSNGKADQYPQNLSVGQNASVILGVSNYEFRKINYTIEVWLINQTTYYNTSDNKNVTLIDHMWFLNKITVELNHTSVNLETPAEFQWEYNYSFSIQRAGRFKLALLLFRAPDYHHYTQYEDYLEIADQLVNTAYRELHLWITVR